MRPAIFANLDFEVALERSTAERKLLLVDATATWCGPCRMMDRITWADASVIAWLDARAIAIQIDIDAYRLVAKRLAIRVMPTVVAFSDGVEVDRVAGLQKPGELIAWLDGLARGETAIDAKRAAIAANPTDDRLRLGLAQALALAGRLDEATTEYVWLWQHMFEREPALSELRPVFLGQHIAQLAKRHEPTREAFGNLRDQAAPEHSPDPATFVNWAALNNILGDSRQTLRWFDSEYQTVANKAELAAAVQEHVGPLLLGANRWFDVWAVYGRRLFDWPLRDLVAKWKTARRRQQQ